MWNVKEDVYDWLDQFDTVLIETLWNVKYTVGMTLDGQLVVLIETLWNVKTLGRFFILLEISINRNIVECKDIIHITERISDCVLIETLWNVKEEYGEDVELTALY